MVAYEQHDKWSLQESLARLTSDPVTLSVLSRLDEKSLASFGRGLVQR